MLNLRNYLPTNIVLDFHQKNIINEIELATKNLDIKKNFLQIFFLKSKSISLIKGIYLYGSVGRGKTMIMEAFYQSWGNKAKSIIHFQDLMQTLQKELFELNLAGESNFYNITKIASKFATLSNLICIDEFEIKDIVDAMVIGKFIKELIKRNVFIFFTSNTQPVDLYKDGLQRDSFLPFVNFIKSKFLICKLDADADYRLMQIVLKNVRILYPANEKNNSNLQIVANELIKNQKSSLPPQNFGRQINFKQSYEDILITNFNEICQQNFSYADYVMICQRYKIIFLFDVPLIPDDANDLIIRFINLIDNVYYYKVTLFASLIDKIENIYSTGSRFSEFQRTISRFNEMNSELYLSNSKINNVLNEKNNV